MNLFLDQVALDGRLQTNLDYWVNSEAWKKDH
jgi:polar amino acid transport system substrate-binding protein